MAGFCQHCGSPLGMGARFCTHCGAAVAAQAFAPTQPLTRPVVGRRVAGVCAGLSRAYGWDLALVRVLAVFGICCSAGLVGVGYLACWIGIPEETEALPPRM